MRQVERDLNQHERGSSPPPKACHARRPTFPSTVKHDTTVTSSYFGLDHNSSYAGQGLTYPNFGFRKYYFSCLAILIMFLSAVVYCDWRGKLLFFLWV